MDLAQSKLVDIPTITSQHDTAGDSWNGNLLTGDMFIVGGSHIELPV